MICHRVLQLGGFYIWTYAYSLMRKSGMLYEKMKAADKAVSGTSKGAVDGNGWVRCKAGDGIEKDMEAPLLSSKSLSDEGTASTEQKLITTDTFSSGKLADSKLNFLGRAKEYIVRLAVELITPPTVAAILGLIFGATLWLKSLIIGAAAPLRVVQDSIQLLGDGTIPCITLILGGNLTQGGIRKSRLKFSVILAVLFLKYTIIPASGLAVIIAAGKLGFLAEDPLYRYTLLLQYTLPPAMNIGTMAELFDVAREECSVLFLWNYLVCAFALTIWSTVYMWFLS
ncbi:hypothetical protein Taro_026615 [Colocasia esculenta]|uniref:Auxin efflux carrier family protein n=1 Tax=Colocasia esculenta TaxID=4460 RepID=A0A843VBV0_COLES|nr:hypothetical protein [Colocasia esculenta]